MPELTDDEIRNVVQEEVEKHMLAFPHSSWASFEGEDPDDVVVTTRLAALTVTENSKALENILLNQNVFTQKIESIADVVLGDERINFDGHVVRSGGLQKLVADSHNGGMKVKLPPSVMASLVTAMAGIFGTLLILIFQHI